MDKPINLMQVVFSLETGGLENFVVNLVKKLDRSKYNLCVCSLNRDGILREKLLNLNVPVFTEQKREGIDYTLTCRLANLIKDKKIDLIHTHNPTPWLYGAIAAKFARAKAIVHTEHSNLFCNQKRLMLAEKCLSYITDVIITDSEIVTKHLIDKEKIDCGKIRTIFNGIDIGEFQKEIDIKGMKRNLGIKEDSLIIGNVARLEAVKDHATLIQAFDYISQRVPKAVLVIAGDGSLIENLRKMADDLGIKEKVYFLGNRMDIPKVMAIFDVFVLSSISEGLPLALLEAMSAKKPIAATCVGGNPEIVIHNETGLLVPPKDPKGLAAAIVELLTDLNMAKTMGDNGYRRVRQYFDINDMKERYEEIYDNLCVNKMRLCQH